VERIVPDGCPEIVVHAATPFARLGADGERTSQRPAVLSGQLHRSILLAPAGRVDVFGIRFHPWGAGLCIRGPLHEATDRLPPLADVLGPDAAALEEAVRSRDDLAGRVEAATRWLLLRASRARPVPRVLVAAARLAEATRGRLPVAVLAEETGTGHRRLQRLFRDHVGVGPKTLSRIARVQGVIRRLRAGPRASWAHVGIDAGYADQAHLTREFSDIVGLPPTAYAREAHLVADLFAREG
jgi:AraC-like DNA-binding protein